MRRMLALPTVLLVLSCSAPSEGPLAPQRSALPDDNEPPTAEVVTDCGYMWCLFEGVLEGNDPDGTIVACEYEIEGRTYGACTLFHEWAEPGMKEIRFSVWDDDGAMGTTTFEVEARVSPITVSTQHTRVKKQDFITVSWSGAAGANVRLMRTGGDPEVYANPMNVEVPNTGEWVDELEAKCVGFVYTIWELEGAEYSYPPHRSTCEKGKGGGKK